MIFSGWQATMTLRPSLKWLLPILAVALIAMFMAVASVHKSQSALAAAVFAIAVIATGIRTNSPLWRCLRTANPPRVTHREALMPTVMLIALAYAWCGLAFYAIYLGTSLKWQHGWEYGTAMIVVALGHAYFLTRLAKPQHVLASAAAVQTAVRLAGAQAIAIGLALFWLISSGKLSSVRGDWPANQLFLAGGFAVMCLSMIVLKTHAAIGDPRPDRREPPLTQT
jgi:hypothetical protein